MKKRFSRQFGQYHITVTEYGENARIAIVGNTNANVGHFYPNNFARFNRHPEGENHDWNRPQIIGMNWEYGMTKSVKAWLYGFVTKNRLKINVDG